MWKDHPEKVLAFTEEFATKNPKTVKAVMRAVLEASQWNDKLENRPRMAEVVAQPQYINTSKEIILGRMLGDYDYGDGRKEKDKYYMTFFDRQTNFPLKSHGVWWLTQFRRWGMVKEAPDYKGIVDRVHRPDIFREVAKEMGVETPREDMKKETFFDGVTFDPAEPGEVRQELRRSHSMGELRTTHATVRSCRAWSCRGSGIAAVVVLWALVSQTVAPDLPSPVKTWSESRRYVLDPFFKDGEMNQGIGRLAFYSLVRVGKGYLLALLIGTPLGFLLGLSRGFHQSFDPIIQFLRPISPLAWLPLGLVVFQKSEPAAIFTIALCAMWPTVINTAVGVRGISQDYLNVGRVLKLSRTKMLTKIIIPASLPYVFTGYRLSLGLAWLVIVAAEMLTGTPGVGGFLWQEYNSLVYSHIILCVITIGAIGFVLDRLMGLVEARFKTT